MSQESHAMSKLLRVVPSITLSLAREILACVIEEAERQEVAVSVAIVGAGGEVVLTAHMDGAPPPSRAIALSKAMTAAAFRDSTAEWEERLACCSAMVRQGLPLQPGLAFFGGGEPFVHQGDVIGAVGLSGASESVDVACARAASERVKALLQGLPD
jgi:uncharacterized protein GlcG (DUF336 family)